MLESGWSEGVFDEVVDKFEPVYGRFDPAAHVFAGAGRRYASSADYEQQVYEMVEDDLDEALAVGGSPVKAALEVFRILRDQLRSVIEFGGLTVESYLDFQTNIRGRINRLEAGPPPLRSQQLLALMDAGIVRVPFGPNPLLTGMPDGRVTIRSTELGVEAAATVNGVVRGHLDLPSLVRSSSPLLNRLYAEGRLTQMGYGSTLVGSVSIDRNFHPYDVDGRLQPHDFAARGAHRGSPLLHPLPPFASEPHPGRPRCAGVRGERLRVIDRTFAEIDAAQAVAVANA